MANFITINNVADILGASVASIAKWVANGSYPAHTDERGRVGFHMEDLAGVAPIRSMLESAWDEEMAVTPLRDYTSVELFAGAGGLALGMHKAGLRHALLSEVDKTACATLRANRPEWNVAHGDVRALDFSPLRGKVDFMSGGFPCQAFSFAGKKGGFGDTRGTLFFEMARAVSEIRPKVFVGENVKGLLSHDDGRTLATIENVVAELGYTLVPPRVLKAVMFQVPQKRERLILVAIRNDYAGRVNFRWPSPFRRVLTLRDALEGGVLYDCAVPPSAGQSYPEKKRKVLALVPEGGRLAQPARRRPKRIFGEELLFGRRQDRHGAPPVDGRTLAHAHLRAGAEADREVPPHRDAAADSPRVCPDPDFPRRMVFCRHDGRTI